MTRTEMRRDGRSESEMLRLVSGLLDSGRCLDPDDEDDEERLYDLDDDGIEVPGDGSVWLLRRSWMSHPRGSIVVVLPNDPAVMCRVYKED